MNTFTASDSTSGNGFLSFISGTLERFADIGVETTAQVLPVWAGQQLGLQSQNQLSQPTFQPAGSLQPTQAQTTQSSTATPQSNAGVLSINTNTAVLLGGGLILGLVLLNR